MITTEQKVFGDKTYGRVLNNGNVVDATVSFYKSFPGGIKRLMVLPINKTSSIYKRIWKD